MDLNLDTLLAAVQDTGVSRLQDTLGLDAGQAAGAVEATVSSLVGQATSSTASLPALVSSLASGEGTNILEGIADPSAMASAVAEKLGVGSEMASGIVQTLLPVLQEALGRLLSGGSGISGMLGGLLGD